MTRKRTIKQGILLIVPLFAFAILFAGCGGSGGGGSAVVPKYGNLQATVEFPPEPAKGAGRAAESTSSCTTESTSPYTATVSVDEFSAAGAGTSKSSTTIDITCNSTTGKYGGSFKLTQIPVGSNYIVHATKYYNYSETSSAPRAANATTAVAHAGAIVDTVSDGVTSSVSVTATSTIVALAALRYALTRSTPVAMSDTATITTAVKTALATAVAEFLADNASTISSSDFVYVSSYDIFVPSTWSSITLYYDYDGDGDEDPFTLAQLLDALISLAGLDTPTVSKFCVEASSNASGGCSSSASNISSSATTTTNVPYDAPAFKVVFTESMDISVNLNTAATLSASGFSIALTKSDTGGALTINSTNALSYGTFSWGTTTKLGDTLVFALKTNSQLSANGLKQLQSSSTYNITAWTAPSNVKSAGDVAVSTTGISTSGQFTTLDSTAPTAYKFYINTTEISTSATSATSVPYDSPSFKVVFSESMNSALAASAFDGSGGSITIVRSDTSGTITINSSNALSYGTFQWQTTNFTDDTLVYTLYSNATLTANGLKTLVSGKTYNVTSWSITTNVKDLAGNALSTTGISTTGTFTTQ